MQPEVEDLGQGACCKEGGRLNTITIELIEGRTYKQGSAQGIYPKYVMLATQ
ncbi:Hypothetical protein CINCED_3A002436 [Cinara cedri]|uniref:Uncharacterized protein n=1 Tax=Cinara cedri TaxID=506608 RepID=A0A5E4MUN0_9HEMI|nr:Hypothetical protein CINCED_3A002436 [Cinara cedri]